MISINNLCFQKKGLIHMQKSYWSKGGIYIVELTESPVSIHCNCKAGSIGMLCKHTLTLLLSDDVSSPLPEDIKISYQNYIST